MLAGSFLEGFSVGGPAAGDEGAPEPSWEALALRLDSRECLAEAESLETSCSFTSVLAFGCWQPGGWWPFSAVSSPAFLQTDLAELPPAFLASKVVLPRSVDLRVSFCRKADLKKDSPFSSDLLSLFRAAFMLVLGERRLAMEELLMCLPSPRASPALAWLTRGELGLELEVTLALSETRLCLEPSLLKLRSEVLPFPGGKGPLVAGPEAFLAVVEEAVEAREEAGFSFWGDGEGPGPGAEEGDSFLGRAGAGEECRPLGLEESALFRVRNGFTEMFPETGEEGDGLERDDSWLAKTDRPFRELPSGSDARLELGGLWAVLSGFLEREPGWPGGFTSLTGELSTESL